MTKSKAKKILQIASITLITIPILIISFWIYFKNMPDYEVVCKVVRKLDIDKTHTHKGKTYHDGVGNYMDVNSKLYGYARLEVSTNTYYSYKEGEYIVFYMDEMSLESKFNTKVETNVIWDNFQIIVLTSLGLLFALLIAYLIIAFKYDL